MTHEQLKAAEGVLYNPPAVKSQRKYPVALFVIAGLALAAIFALHHNHAPAPDEISATLSVAETNPETGVPMTELDIDAERVAWLVLGKSLEQRALGTAKNPAAEQAAFDAISNAETTKALSAAQRADDMNRFDALIDSLNDIKEIEAREVLRQKLNETPEERRIIAKFVWTHSAALL
jgi:hypothetical protein